MTAADVPRSLIIASEPLTSDAVASRRRSLMLIAEAGLDGAPEFEARDSMSEPTRFPSPAVLLGGETRLT
jgi:hypothetical protein